MNNIFHVARFDGDGIGPEINREAVKVLNAVSNFLGNFKCEFEPLPAGAALYRETGVALPDESKEKAKQADAILLGSIGLPEVTKADGTEVQGDMIVITRKEFDLYKGVRPAKLRPNVPSPLRNIGKGIDLVVIREQSEGMFASYQSSHTIHDEVYTDSMIVTRKGTERIARTAFELSQKRNGAPADGQKRVTCVDKSNNFKAMAFFRKIYNEIAGQYSDVAKDYAYIDAIMIWILQKPDFYDVLVTENMYGDILSDLTAATIGGMGFAPSGDIGDDHAMFQCAGGSAPTIAGQNIANPIAQILSGAMMLDWLGQRHGVDEAVVAAQAIDQAVDSVLVAGHLTSDIGGKTKTDEFGDLVVEHLKTVLDLI
jgi:3-isopropylmalate dehydrogenase